MADSTTVQSGLAALTANGLDVAEPNEGGNFGSVGVLTPAQTRATQALVSAPGIFVPSIANGLLAAYAARIVAAGSTIAKADLDAIREPLERLMRTTCWAKIKELWLPAGNDLTGALQAQIAAALPAVSLYRAVQWKY